MKKVLVIAADLDPKDLGGAELHLVEVVKSLCPKYNFTVLVGEKTTVTETWKNAVKVIPVKYSKFRNLQNIFFAFAAVFAGLKTLRRTKFDFIWAKQEFPQGLTGAVLSKISGLPLYITAQNPLAYKEEMVIIGPAGLPTLPIFQLVKLLVSWALKTATVVAAVSSYSRQQALKLGAKWVEIIPNGIDLGVYKMRSKRASQHSFVFVTTSTLIPRNGIDVAIRGLALLPRKLKWSFEIAGEGPEREMLEALAKSLKIREKVNFLGTLTGAQVRQLLQKADIFIRPSRHEGFGVSYLEAMAVGIPVITTLAGGQKDFIKDRETGMAVHVDDPEGVTNAIRKLIADRQLYQTIVKNGRKVVEEKYRWETISKKIDAIFTKI